MPRVFEDFDRLISSRVFQAFHNVTFSRSREQKLRFAAGDFDTSFSQSFVTFGSDLLRSCQICFFRCLGCCSECSVICVYSKGLTTQPLNMSPQKKMNNSGDRTLSCGFLEVSKNLPDVLEIINLYNNPSSHTES